MKTQTTDETAGETVVPESGGGRSQQRFQWKSLHVTIPSVPSANNTVIKNAVVRRSTFVGWRWSPTIWRPDNEMSPMTTFDFINKIKMSDRS